MATKTLCTSKVVHTTVYGQMELPNFVNQLKKDRPSELFHSYYSREKPCYFITEYLEHGVMIYADSWADKTPQKKTFDKLQRELGSQGIELFYYNTKSQTVS